MLRDISTAKEVEDDASAVELLTVPFDEGEGTRVYIPLSATFQAMSGGITHDILSF